MDFVTKARPQLVLNIYMYKKDLEIRIYCSVEGFPQRNAQWAKEPLLVIFNPGRLVLRPNNAVWKPPEPYMQQCLQVTI